MPASAPRPPEPPDSEAPTDAELLARHVAGDREAFGELFRRHRTRLWAVAIRTLTNPDDAAEALQDAMVKAYQGAGSFRGTAAVTTWLHRIVVNACLDRIRAAKRRPTVPLDDEPVPAVGTMHRPPTDPADAAAAMSVRRVLAELPFEQRAVLVYIDMLGYPVDDVAAILKIRPGTVKSRASRARRRLAARLTELGLGEIERTPRRDGTGEGNPGVAVRVEPDASEPARPVREEETRG